MPTLDLVHILINVVPNPTPSLGSSLGYRGSVHLGKHGEGRVGAGFV